MSELINQSEIKSQPKKIGRYILLAVVVFIFAAMFYKSSPEKK